MWASWTRNCSVADGGCRSGLFPGRFLVRLRLRLRFAFVGVRFVVPFQAGGRTSVAAFG